MNDIIRLNDIQEEVLNGALLGDGCLTNNGKDNTNAQFIYTSKIYNHVKYIYDYISEYSTNSGIVKQEYFDKRTKNTYCRYSFRTQLNLYFTEKRNLWYVNGVKIIPKDLLLTPLTCLVWYIGDGCICNSNRSQFIKISTHCFSLRDIENILIPQLSKFDAKPMKANNEDQYFIYIPRYKIKDFLSYIGECPFEEYRYKWEYKEYKNFSIKNNGNFINEIIELFNQGYSAGTIAKIKNVDRNTIVKYLKKMNIDYNKNKYKNKNIKE